MPVLMNKGDDVRRAAWLFYTDRATLDAWGHAIVEGRWDSARLVVDEEQVQAAKKASAPVEVWAQAKALIPEDFDLEVVRGEVMSRAQAELERARQAAEEGADEDGGQDDAAEGAGEGGGQDDAAEGAGATGERAGAGDAADAGESDEGADAADPADPFDYEPIPAPDGLRVLVGTTTRQAAQSYLLPHEGSDQEGVPDDCDTDLPGLQMLAQLIDYMRDSSDGLPAQAVWHIDPSGILRMVRAKKVKVMAGNVLSVKS